MKLAELVGTLDAIDAQRETLKKFWQVVLPKIEVPTDEQFALWLGLYGFTITHFAIRETSRKCARMEGRMTALHAVRFVSSVASERYRTITPEAA